MSIPGWYSDPGGVPGRFRYWDGQRWSKGTSASPSGPPPDGEPSPRRPGGSRGWIVALVVLLVAVALVVAAVLVLGGRPTSGAREDTNSASPTVSGWDETSTPAPPSGATQVACPVATQPSQSAQTPGRLTADTLSVARIDGWDQANLPDLPWAYDVHRQSTRVVVGNGWGWYHSQAVALLPNLPEHPVEAGTPPDVQTWAQRTLECWTTSQNFPGLTGRTLTRDEAVTVDTYHGGWRITAEVTMSFAALPTVPGATIDIIVVDVGQPKGHLGLYVASCTLHDEACLALVQDAIAGLRVGP